MISSLFRVPGGDEARDTEKKEEDRLVCRWRKAFHTNALRRQGSIHSGNNFVCSGNLLCVQFELARPTRSIKR